jgi:hypothetical protein
VRFPELSKANYIECNLHAVRWIGVRGVRVGVT